ncbi:hypothetical protein DVH02_33945 [Streptomyces corynorhini]|uniref:Uncharacterized protein n=1 Tax=Streptomyces corynorhini TaxID=2282652 RepID=A0A370AMC5_9ACTN|nr:hypothetical protein DVH02_33945 [Streptomyces corynorhini]
MPRRGADQGRAPDLGEGCGEGCEAADSSAQKALYKRPGEVIFPSTAAHTLRATLAASCSLVSLAVQSLRSM